MLPYIVAGATYAFACAVQPGPFQAFLIARTMSVGRRRTMPASLAPLLSDGPIIVVVLLVLSRLTDRVSQGLQVAGGVFLLYLAAGAFRSWRDYGEGPARETAGTGRMVFEAAFVNLLNPNPYLGWSLVMGPLLIKGWRESPPNGIALLIGFYATMVLALAGTIVLFGSVKVAGPRVARVLVGLSAIALSGFACYQLWSGLRGLLGG
jgi:threonine/homoserine/homoserine lactone efflux protein